MPPTPAKYLRSHDDRVLGGVAGGLGRAFGVDAIIFRIALGALVFAGGLGLLIYAAALVLVPVDDGTGRPAPRATTTRAALGRALVLGAIGTAILFGAALAFWGSAWATAAGGGVLVASVVLALGAVLVVGGLRGNARLRWLALPAIVVALPAAIVSAADVSLDGGVGERTYRPAGADRLPSGYRLGMGELVVDLRGLDWRDGRRVALDLDVGVGHAVVIVPEAVCVGARSEISAGYADVFGRDAGGVEVEQDVQRAPAATTPGLRLDVRMGVGAFEVLHDDPEEPRRRPVPERHRFDSEGYHDGGDSQARRDAQRAADRACQAGAA